MQSQHAPNPISQDQLKSWLKRNDLPYSSQIIAELRSYATDALIYQLRQSNERIKTTHIESGPKGYPDEETTTEYIRKAADLYRPINVDWQSDSTDTLYIKRVHGKVRLEGYTSIDSKATVSIDSKATVTDLLLICMVATGQSNFRHQLIRLWFDQGILRPELKPDVFTLIEPNRRLDGLLFFISENISIAPRDVGAIIESIPADERALAVMALHEHAGLSVSRLMGDERFDLAKAIAAVNSIDNGQFRHHCLDKGAAINCLIQMAAQSAEYDTANQATQLRLDVIQKATINSASIEAAFIITPPSDWPLLIRLENIKAYLLSRWNSTKKVRYAVSPSALADARKCCETENGRSQYFKEKNPENILYERWMLMLYASLTDETAWLSTSSRKGILSAENESQLIEKVIAALTTDSHSRSGSAAFRNEPILNLQTLKLANEPVLPYLQCVLADILLGHAKVSPCGSTVITLMIAVQKIVQLQSIHDMQRETGAAHIPVVAEAVVMGDDGGGKMSPQEFEQYHEVASSVEATVVDEHKKMSPEEQAVDEQGVEIHQATAVSMQSDEQQSEAAVLSTASMQPSAPDIQAMPELTKIREKVSTFLGAGFHQEPMLAIAKKLISESLPKFYINSQQDGSAMMQSASAMYAPPVPSAPPLPQESASSMYSSPQKGG